MIPFEEYVHARGGGLLHLAYALSGNQWAAEELVQGRRAEFSDWVGSTSELRIFVSGGRVLQIRQQPLSPSAELSPDDLARFAEGIRVLDG